MFSKRTCMRPRKKNRELPACVYHKHGAYWYVKKAAEGPIAAVQIFGGESAPPTH